MWLSCLMLSVPYVPRLSYVLHYVTVLCLAFCALRSPTILCLTLCDCPVSCVLCLTFPDYPMSYIMWLSCVLRSSKIHQCKNYVKWLFVMVWELIPYVLHSMHGVRINPLCLTVYDYPVSCVMWWQSCVLRSVTIMCPAVYVLHSVASCVLRSVSYVLWLFYNRTVSCVLCLGFCDYLVLFVLWSWPCRVVPSVTMPWLCDYAVTLWLWRDSVIMPWRTFYDHTV